MTTADGQARAHLEALRSALGEVEGEFDHVAVWGRSLARLLARGGRLLVAGNGGSAAHAQHLTAELVGRYRTERRPFSALALHAETSSLTAIANDYGYESALARQVEAHGRPGDILLAISTSGASPNVLAAVAAANRFGLRTWALTGPRPNALDAASDDAIAVDAPTAATVQELHQIVVHLLCDAVDHEIEHAAPPTGDANVLDWPELLELRDRWRQTGETVVWTNGVFDLLHVGHVRSLEAAKRLGDILVVGVNSDDTVRERKGEGRPIVPAAERAAVVAALKPVDYVIQFDEPTPSEALDRLRPEIHCKGADYAPPNGRPVPEAAVVEAYGGRVEYLPLVDGLSSTRLVDLLGSSPHAGG